jgi:hypothetical protein
VCPMGTTLAVIRAESVILITIRPEDSADD